jgi:hypothetical protein
MHITETIYTVGHSIRPNRLERYEETTRKLWDNRDV